jgi:glycosyltransferase involved in cell wall biosynthesis
MSAPVTTAEPLVSVVTPFFNTEAYLAECVDSVLAQTYTNFEYILVDNQSTDRSAEIVESRVKRDPRLRLVKTPRFFTQVQNYNFALQQISSTSRYCKMVQADDWVFPRCLVEMVDLAEVHPNVAMVSSYYLWGRRVNGTGLSPDRTVISGREACRLHLLDEAYLFGSPTVVLFRADLVRARQPFYEEGRLFEDGETAYELMREHDLGFVHQILTYVRRQDDSLWGSSESFHPLELIPLIMLRRYGAEFLTAEERQRRLREVETSYYRRLARAWLIRREPAFWKYHREGLANAGIELRKRDLVPHLFRAVLEAVAPPALSRRLARDGELRQ